MKISTSKPYDPKKIYPKRSKLQELATRRNWEIAIVKGACSQLDAISSKYKSGFCFTMSAQERMLTDIKADYNLQKQNYKRALDKQ